MILHNLKPSREPGLRYLCKRSIYGSDTLQVKFGVADRNCERRIRGFILISRCRAKFPVCLVWRYCKLLSLCGRPPECQRNCTNHSSAFFPWRELRRRWKCKFMRFPWVLTVGLEQKSTVLLQRVECRRLKIFWSSQFGMETITHITIKISFTRNAKRIFDYLVFALLLVVACSKIFVIRRQNKFVSSATLSL